jgi:hypothetical protein
LGYQLKAGSGINLGLQYYYGLQYNRSLYVIAGMPIGKGKTAKTAEAKKALEEKTTLPKS